MKTAINDLMKANKKVTSKTRYSCGIMESPEGIKEDRAQFFFESPDGQDYEFFAALRGLGWADAGFNAPYYWNVIKDGIKISYVEGDVYVNQI